MATSLSFTGSNKNVGNYQGFSFYLTAEGASEVISEDVVMSSLSFPEPTSGGSTDPVYLNVWEGDGSSAYTYLGSSNNADYCSPSKTATWRFNGLTLSLSKKYLVLFGTSASNSFTSTTARVPVYSVTAENTHTVFGTLPNNPPSGTPQAWAPQMTLQFGLPHTDTDAKLKLKIMTSAQLSDETIETDTFYVNNDTKQLFLGSKLLVGSSGGSLPSQSGNSGKFLTTNGTDASWASIDMCESIENKNDTVASSDKISLWQGTYEEFNNVQIPAYIWKNDTSYEFGLIPYGGSSTNPRNMYITTKYMYLMVGQSLRIFDKNLNLVSEIDVSSAYNLCISADDTIFYYIRTTTPMSLYKIKNGITTKCNTPLEGSTRNVRNFFYFKNKLISFSSATNLVISEDEGMTWTDVSSIIPSGTWGNAMSVVGDVVFCNDGTSMWVSSDFTNWTECDTFLKYITLDKNGYIGHPNASSSGSTFYTSTDGINWVNTNIALPSTSFTGLVCKDEIYYASGVENEYVLSQSSDLSTWTTITTSQENASIRNVYSFGESVVFTYNNMYVYNFGYVTSGKIRLTKEEIPTTSTTLYSLGGIKASERISSVNEGYITLSDSSVLNGPYDGYLTDTLSNVEPNITAIVKGYGIYRGNDNFISESVSYISEKDKTQIMSSGKFINGVPALNNKPYMDMNGSTYLYRDYEDGYASLEYNESIYGMVVKGSNGIYINTKGEYTYDGIIFYKNIETPYSPYNSFNFVIYDGKRFVGLVSGNPTSWVCTSEDGLHWTKYSEFSAIWASGLAYKNGVYVCGSSTTSNNNIYYSSDLNNWTSVSTNLKYPQYICANSSVFVITSESGNNKTILYSTNGSSWTSVTLDGFLNTNQKKLSLVDDTIFVHTTQGGRYTTNGSTWASAPFAANFVCKINGTYYAYVNGETRLYHSDTLLGTYTKYNKYMSFQYLSEINNKIYGTYSVFDPLKATEKQLEKINYITDDYLNSTLESYKSIKNTSAPTSSTPGSIGQLYVDTNTGTGYMCVGFSNGSYTWKQITV